MPTYTAQFSHGTAADSFYARLTTNPGGYYALNIKRNRKGGRIVTWDLDEAARSAHIRHLYADSDDAGRAFAERECSPVIYEVSMRETVSYEGTSPDGSRHATLNGVRVHITY
jgi:hypothetical protein